MKKREGTDCGHGINRYLRPCLECGDLPLKPVETPAQKRGRSSRSKGKRGELAAREPLELLTGLEWERGARQSRAKGGEGSPDLVCPGRPCLHPEVKVGKSPPCLPALAQAIADAGLGCVPFALVKKDRGKWVLIVEVDRFEELCRALRGGGL